MDYLQLGTVTNRGRNPIDTPPLFLLKAAPTHYLVAGSLSSAVLFAARLWCIQQTPISFVLPWVNPFIS